VTDIAPVYAEGRQRITDLVRGISPDAASAKVPTCPAWTVHDVVAHLTGVCADVLAGNLAGVATDPWTAEQVDARRNRSMAELITEWSHVAPQVEAFAGSFPGRTGAQWVLDLTTHEHDIRTALGQPGARDSAGVLVGLEFLVIVGFRASLSARGLGPLEVRANGHTWIAGSTTPHAPDEQGIAAAVGAAMEAGLLAVDEPPPPSEPPVGTVEAPPFEFFRAMTGRRSTAQISRLGWSIDPSPYLGAFQFGPFTLSAADIDE
jgi:uncharacterized protein (TIGR03083 family)